MTVADLTVPVPPMVQALGLGLPTDEEVAFDELIGKLAARVSKVEQLEAELAEARAEASDLRKRLGAEQIITRTFGNALLAFAHTWLQHGKIERIAPDLLLIPRDSYRRMEMSAVDVTEVPQGVGIQVRQRNPQTLIVNGKEV